MPDLCDLLFHGRDFCKVDGADEERKIGVGEIDRPIPRENGNQSYPHHTNAAHSLHNNHIGFVSFISSMQLISWSNT